MPEKTDISVIISANEMEVYVNLPVWFEEVVVDTEESADNENDAEVTDNNSNGKIHIYTKQEVYEALEKKNVKAGIDEAMIDRITSGTLYEKDYLVARGTEPIHGVDGYFEFLFNTELSRKPSIRPDGSADYYSIHLVELVKANQEVAIYHDPIEGQNGLTVKGRVLLAKRGRNLPPIAGTGFFKVDKSHVYVSQIDGKIEYKNKRITILPVYEINGDVDLKTGNVDFRGDVIIHGNVRSGMKVNAVGTCTLDGVLEGAEVTADKTILIRGGIQGGGRALVKCSEDIHAGYIEYANVVAEGDITADSIVNSDVISNKMIKAGGKKSCIVGGKVSAVGGVVATMLGNRNGTKTEVSAGRNLKMMKDMLSLQTALNEDQSMVEKIEDAIAVYKHGQQAGSEQKRGSEVKMVELLRAKVSKQADVAKNQNKLDYYNVLLERAEKAMVTVGKEIFPGVEVSINSVKTVITDHQDQVQFIESDKKIRMYSGTIEDVE